MDGGAEARERKHLTKLVSRWLLSVALTHLDCCVSFLFALFGLHGFTPELGHPEAIAVLCT